MSEKCNSHLLDIIKDRQPELSEEQAAKVAHDLLNFPYRRNHNAWGGKVWLGENIDNRYGRNGTEFLIGTEIFECSTGWSKDDHLARAWFLADAANDVLNELHEKSETATILELSNGNIRKSRAPTRVVERLSKSGSRSKNIEFLALNPHPNIHSIECELERLKAELESVPEDQLKKRNKIQSDILQAIGLIAASRSNHGNISTYRETSTGRLAGQGHHLQNCSSNVCAIALPGYYECDAENCHYCLIQQIALHHGMHMPYLDSYLRDKHGWRQSISHHCNVNGVTGDDFKDIESSVKSSLIALAYGAQLGPVKTSIAKAFNSYEIAALFCSHEKVKGLRAEVSVAMNLIVNIAKRSVGRNGYIKNGVGASRLLKDMPDTSILAFVLQGLESKVMQVAMPVVDQEIAVWKHDGFLVKNIVSAATCARMTELVEAETNFRMEFCVNPVSVR